MNLITTHPRIRTLVLLFAAEQRSRAVFLKFLLGLGSQWLEASQPSDEKVSFYRHKIMTSMYPSDINPPL